MRWMLVLLLAASCDSGGPCQPRHGLYNYSLTPSASATCGAIPAVVVNVDRGDVSACSGGSSTNDNMCLVAIDLTCPTKDGGSLTSRGQVSWSEDGNSGSGTMYLELHDITGALVCLGNYQVSYKHL